VVICSVINLSVLTQLRPLSPVMLWSLRVAYIPILPSFSLSLSSWHLYLRGWEQTSVTDRYSRVAFSLTEWRREESTTMSEWRHAAADSTINTLNYIYLYFTKSMVVIVRIEQTNKQTTRQITRQLNNRYLTIRYILTKFTEFAFKRLARFSHGSLDMSKEKQR